MKGLSTETTKEDMVLAFIQVLDIDTAMAEFFLESSGWDIEAAVSIYLENAGQSGVTGSSSSFVAAQFSAGMGDKQAVHQGKRARAAERVPRYLPLDVFIHGLPDGWAAKVSRHSGEIYFIHTATGHRQNAVPPGFADIPQDQQDVTMRDEKDEADTGMVAGSPDNGSGMTGGFAFAPPPVPPSMSMEGDMANEAPTGGEGVVEAMSMNVFEASGPLNQSGDSLGGTGSAGSVASTTGADNNTVGGDTDDCNTEAAVYDDGESRALDGAEEDSIM